MKATAHPSRHRFAASVLLGACLSAALFFGCSDLPVAESPKALRAPLPATAASGLAALEATMHEASSRPDAVVRPGESIQEAADRVGPGGVIVIEPGTYRQSVTIDRPNLTLIGRTAPDGAGAVIENPGGVANGVVVTTNGDGVRLFNFTTRGFDRNGVFMREVEDFLVMRVTAEDNGAYGIFPVLSSNGKIFLCSASGHSDAGIYIGQSQDIRIEHNTAFANVIGYEMSNSARVATRHNRAENNTIGILAVLLPPSPYRTVLTASDYEITHNQVVDNNHPNFAPPEELPAYVPVGSGILVVGADRVTVEQNTVTDHGWVGIGVGSTATFGQLAGLPISGIEPDPEGVIVRRNTVTGNGAHPPSPPFPLPGVDLLWDGTGTANCWEDNAYSTSYPAPLPDCAAS